MSSSPTQEFVRVRCPGCAASLKLKGAVRPGKRIKCPKCQGEIEVSEADFANGTLSTAAPPRPAPPQKPKPQKPKKKATEDDWLDDLGGLDDTAVNFDNTTVLPPRVVSSNPRASNTITPRHTDEGDRGAGGFSLGAFGPVIMSIGGGLVGGIVGAGIWAAIIALTEYEISWIAWAVGALVGIGVRLGSNGEEGPLLGILAVLISFASIYLGKAMGIYFLAARMGQIPPDANPAMVIFFCLVAVPFIMGFFDIIWFGLAGFTAFKIGSGLASDD